MDVNDVNNINLGLPEEAILQDQDPAAGGQNQQDGLQPDLPLEVEADPAEGMGGGQQQAQEEALGGAPQQEAVPPAGAAHQGAAPLAGPILAMDHEQFQALIMNMQALNVGGQQPRPVAAVRGTKLRAFAEVSGSAWQTWKSHFLTVVEINQWNDLRQRQELKAAMMGEAARATKDIGVNEMVPVPGAAPPPGAAAPMQEKTIEFMLTQFEARFLPEAASHTARVEFKNLKQYPHEPILTYSSRARDLFMRAYPDLVANTSSHLIHAFMDGLVDVNVMRFALDHTPTTYHDAVQLVQRKIAVEYSCVRKTNPNLTGRAVFSMDLPEARTISSNYMQTSSSSKTTNNNLECWNCGKKGHIQRECYRRDHFAPRRDRHISFRKNTTIANSTHSVTPFNKGGPKRKSTWKPTKQQLNSLMNLISEMEAEEVGGSTMTLDDSETTTSSPQGNA